MDQNIVQKQEIKSWMSGIDAITLFVNDLDASMQFYRKVFGLTEIFHDDDSYVFKFGGTLLNLLRTSAADELIHPAKVAIGDVGSHFVFTIRVDDVDAICGLLAKRGVKLLNGPMNRPWGPRTASFMDPSGYLWEIAK